MKSELTDAVYNLTERAFGETNVNISPKKSFVKISAEYLNMLISENEKLIQLVNWIGKENSELLNKQQGDREWIKKIVDHQMTMESKGQIQEKLENFKNDSFVERYTEEAIKTYKNEIDQLQNKVIELEKKNIEFQQKILWNHEESSKNSEKMQEEYKAKLSASQENEKKLYSRLELLLREQDRQQEDLKGKFSEFESALEAINNENAEIEKENTKLKQEKTNLQKMLIEIQAKIKEYTEKSKLLHSQLASLEAKNSQLLDENNIMKLNLIEVEKSRDNQDSLVNEQSELKMIVAEQEKMQEMCNNSLEFKSQEIMLWKEKIVKMCEYIKSLEDKIGRKSNVGLKKQHT